LTKLNRIANWAENV